MTAFRAAAAALLVTGCGQLIGVDEYEVTDGCPPGTARAASGGCSAIPKCADDQLPRLGGDCASIGVAECPEDFERDPERPGGCREVLPECPEPNLNALGTTTCGTGLGCSSAAVPNVAATVLEVREDGTNGAYRSIRAALAAAGALTGDVQVNVYRGTYRGSLDVTRPIALYSVCTQETIIEGDDAGVPVVDVAGSARGFRFDGFTIAGLGAAGVRIDGVEDFAMLNVVVRDIGGPGVSIEDTSGPASGTLGPRILVDRALGVGVAAFGANPLALTDVVVTRVRPGADGRATGIHVAPAVSVSPERWAGLPIGGAARWQVESLPSPSVTIERARVAGAVGAAIWVEGTRATLDRVSVRDSRPDPLGQSSGVLVEPRLLGLVPAELTLRASVISGVAGVGVRIEDAKALIEDTTIHSIAASESEEAVVPTGACLGNGIRARARFGAALGPSGDEPVTVRRTVVDGVRESAIHLEGIQATIEQSIVRNVQGCDDGHGDGIAAYGYNFAPGTVILRASRISGTARAAVATFAADFELDGASLEACEPVGALNTDSSMAGASSSLCACNGKWSACSSQAAWLRPALVGFPACDPEESACVESCWEDLLAAQGAAVLAEMSTWAESIPSIRLSATDRLGCVAAPMIPGVRTRIVATVKGYAPAAATNLAHRIGRIIAGQGALVIEDAVDYQAAAQPTRAHPDLRNATFVPFQVCTPLSQPRTDPTEECFSGKGVQGIRGVLLDAQGRPIDAPFAKPVYFSEGSSTPDPSLTETNTNGTGYFYDVPPGEYHLRLVRSDGGSLSCALDPTDEGFEWSEEIGANLYRARADAGLNSFGTRAYCTRDGAGVP